MDRPPTARGVPVVVAAISTRNLLKILAVVLLLLCAGDYRVFAGPQPPGAQDLELAQGWTLKSASGLAADGAALSEAGYQDTGWIPVRRMPATVLQTLQDAGVYPNLYYGKNLLTEVPQDLYKQDWWYRTTFTAPADYRTYQLDFPGINYRADIWLNGHLVADSREIVGMYNHHRLDVTPWIAKGAANTLAVKVTPERAIQDVSGVELADSWYDWINWRYLGYQGPGKNAGNGNSFVPDRNAGIFKPVRLRAFGPVDIGPSAVTTQLALPDLGSARLKVFGVKRQLARDAGVADARNDRTDESGRRYLEDARERKRFTIRQDRLRAARGAERDHRQRHQQACPDEGADIVSRVLHDQKRAARHRDLEHELIEAHHAAALRAGRRIRDPAFRRREHDRRSRALEQAEDAPRDRIERQAHRQDADRIDRRRRRIGPDMADLPDDIGREPCAEHEAGGEHRRDHANAQRRRAHIVERQRRRHAENAGGRLQQHDCGDKGRDVAIDGHCWGEAAFLVFLFVPVLTPLRGRARLKS